MGIQILLLPPTKTLFKGRHFIVSPNKCTLPVQIYKSTNNTQGKKCVSVFSCSWATQTGYLIVKLANMVGAFRRKLGTTEDESNISKPTEILGKSTKTQLRNSPLGGWTEWPSENELKALGYTSSAWKRSVGPWEMYIEEMSAKRENRALVTVFT